MSARWLAHLPDTARWLSFDTRTSAHARTRTHTHSQPHTYTHTRAPKCALHVQTRCHGCVHSTAGRRRSITPHSKASSRWCGCSSPTARTSPRGTNQGPSSTHAAAGVLLGFVLGYCRRRRALGPVYERKIEVDRALVRRAISSCRCARYVLVSRSIVLAYSDVLSTADTGPDVTRRRLRRETPRDLVKGKGAFEAAVTVRPPAAV